MDRSDEIIWLGGESSRGDVLEVHGIDIGLPKKPKRSQILFNEKPKGMQMWSRVPMPEELSRVRGMDE